MTSGEGQEFWKKGIVKIVILLGGLYAAMRHLAKKQIEPESINQENPYISSCGNDNQDGQRQKDDGQKRDVRKTASIYRNRIKPFLDRLLSFIALVLLAPVFAVIALAVYVDDPGPVFFTQTRVGKNKKFFSLHKFRSMKMSTPHDVPTHQLKNPEQYITKVGRVLRKTSLDELPQIWDIFRGKMSIIGPRPALWNQEDLVTEREKYGANDVMPGLTGWAQINGRDELEIEEKARLDGEYVEKLRKGVIDALFLDIKCFLKTIRSIVNSEGIVEGGTGKMENKLSQKADFSEVEEDGQNEYGYRKVFHIDKSCHNKKKILITGAGSYIGESLKEYVSQFYENNLCVDVIDMLDKRWKKHNFSSYDCVLHVAGIAHVDIGTVDKATKAKYYTVNRDLAVETAQTAKTAGVKQFVFLSSMIIYGSKASYKKENIIDEYVMPHPDCYYSDSKWQGDKRVRELGDENFKVAVLRLPMVYGKGSKGNYPALARLSKKLPIFPDVNNQRSMIHIDNLCEFICMLILSGESGIYFPQNAEYTNTTVMVQEIAMIAKHPIIITRIFNPVLMIASCIPGKISGLVNKAFGNSVYSKKLSEYKGINYQVVDLKNSIIRTEI